MSLASPAKQDRIERHLSRQRGAGVRTLAANFGFTFGAKSPQITASARTAEPTPKRRKLDDQDTARRTHQNTDAGESESADEHGSRPKAQRRLVARQEGAVAGTRVDREEDDFVATMKTTKGRAVSKARKQQPQPPISPPMAVEENQPNRRPRRQAATRAIDQVSRGFIEEESNVDKLRRGQDTVPPKRTRTRRTTEIAETSVVVDVVASDVSGETKDAPTKNSMPTPKLKGQAITGAKQGKQKPSKRLPKPNIASEEEFADEIPDPGSVLNATRLPLAETTANPMIRSKTPEKISKHSDHLIEPVQPRSPLRVRSPRKATDKSKSIARRTRKPSKFMVSRDLPAGKLEGEVVGVGTAVESEDVPDLSGSRLKPKKKPRVAPAEARAAGDEQHASISNVPQAARPGIKTYGSRRDQVQRQQVEKEPISTMTALVEQPSKDDTDVDWLLTDQHPGKRTGRQARDVKRKPLKSAAELPDVDLDDLLSNIATYVPRNLGPTAGITGRRK